MKGGREGRVRRPELQATKVLNGGRRRSEGGGRGEQRSCSWESRDEGGLSPSFPSSPPPPPLSADSSASMQSEAMALVQVWIPSSCSCLAPPPSFFCKDERGNGVSLSHSPPPPLSMKEVKGGGAASPPVAESSDMLFCSNRRDAAGCAPCWDRAVVTDEGME